MGFRGGFGMERCKVRKRAECVVHDPAHPLREDENFLPGLNGRQTLAPALLGSVQFAEEVVYHHAARIDGAPPAMLTTGKRRKRQHFAPEHAGLHGITMSEPRLRRKLNQV